MVDEVEKRSTKKYKLRNRKCYPYRSRLKGKNVVTDGEYKHLNTTTTTI